MAVIGRTEILYDTVRFLINAGHRVKLILTAKEAPEYTRKAKDFEALAEETGAKYLCTAAINSPKTITIIKEAGPMDIGISMNYTNFISQEVIDLFPYGILNAHGGDLPRYRGNACQAWAIINGEERIGLCIHKMIGSELDAGDIIARDYLEIDMNTKIGNVWQWMMSRIPVLFGEAVKKLAGDKHYCLQKHGVRADETMRCYPRRPEDGRIAWNKSNRDILRLINATSKPYDGAFCFFDGKKMIIWDAELVEDNELYCAVPGQIASIDNTSGSTIVITGKGKLKINEISFGDFSGRPSVVIKSIRNRLV